MELKMMPIIFSTRSLLSNGIVTMCVSPPHKVIRIICTTGTKEVRRITPRKIAGIIMSSLFIVLWCPGLAPNVRIHAIIACISALVARPIYGEKVPWRG
jgi:hypothetical protein